MSSLQPAPIVGAATLLLVALPSSLLFAQTGAGALAGTRRQITAAATTGAIGVDGVLDEPVWQQAAPATGFVQAEPHEGQPASEATEVRVAYDGDALYVAVVCHDSDAAGLIVNDIRKDFTPGEQDSVELMLDTFADRRNGFVFATNPQGARSDSQFANEGREVNTNWDGVWTVATRIGADGWTAEFRIPFKTLRFESGASRTWGINVARRIRRRYEIDYWAPVGRVYNIYRASLDGDLTGLPDVSQGHNLRVKPFVAASTTRGTGQPSFDSSADAGLDLKYGVTPSLTLDVTVTPDFAQAEADEQQVNLTQFSLYFPEKREFFLENSGTFYFGDIPRESRVASRFSPPEEELLLFFSRRIGLTPTGAQIPIAAGARLTGRAAGLGVGVMTIQTQEQNGQPGNNYTVIRARRDVFKNGDVGAVFLSRQSAGASSDYNRVAGVDANFRFFRALNFNSFITKSMTPGMDGGDLAGKSSVSWNANFLHMQYSFLTVGENFRDDMGFIRRTGIRKHFVDVGVRPRPAALRTFHVRELHPHARFNRYLDHSNVERTRSDHFGLTAFFDHGEYFEFSVSPKMERIDVPFDMHTGAAFLPGRYSWHEQMVELGTDRSKPLSTALVYTGGGFWNGTQKSTKLNVSYRPSYRLLLDLTLQRNDITLPAPLRSFVTNLINVRTGYAFNTKMFLDALLQYNTDTKQLDANVRFNLIHRPLSDLFIVYNEQRQTELDITAGRGLILKYTHMLSF